MTNLPEEFFDAGEGENWSLKKQQHLDDIFCWGKKGRQLLSNPRVISAEINPYELVTVKKFDQ